MRAHRSPARAAAIAALTVALLSSCQRAEEPPAPEIRPVRVVRIGQVAAGGILALTGTVQAQTEVNLSFRIDGRLVERKVNVGDSLRPGQLVARLDPQNEDSALQAARAQLAAARAQLVEARSNFERMRGLVAENAVSRANFERAEALLKTSESQVEATQSQVAIAENRLGYTRLASDVAGVVTAQGAEPGEVVGAGRMIVQVAKQGGRDAVLDVPAQAKDGMLANPEITVALTMEPKVTATARVREVSPRADPVTGTFRMRVSLVDPPPAMRLGSTVTARIKAAPAKGPVTYVIPVSALVRADRQSAVWIVDPRNSTVASRTIEVARFDPSHVTVASGLNPGDIVVTAGVQALRPGMKVRLLEAQK